MVLPALAISIFLVLLVFSFWYLDAFFLQAEKKYRELYRWVVNNRKNSEEHLYDLNEFTRKVNGTETNLLQNVKGKCRIMFSKTLRWFYLAPALFVVALLVFNIVKALC